MTIAKATIIKRAKEVGGKRMPCYVKFVFSFFLFLTFFITVRSSVYATNYYVDSVITDTNPASATPDFTTYNPTTFETTGGVSSVYKTIADVNLKSFNAGDFIYFRKGQTWNEQLTIAQSGTVGGGPITFGAYGAGNKPIIDGQSTRSYAITFGGLNYITLDNLQVQNATVRNIWSDSAGGNITLIILILWEELLGYIFVTSPIQLILISPSLMVLALVFIYPIPPQT
jgi:hypothetical protein